MKTLLTRSSEEAANIISRGGLAAFPTETVYGLGADVFNERAVARIFQAKRRPADNPLIAHIADAEHIGELAEFVSPEAQCFIDAFFPGPLTIVLNKTSRVPLIATAGLDTIGIRMPRHGLARRFLAACGTPLVAPSANLSGRPSPTTWTAVLEDLDGRIDCILQGDATDIGLESTVVDCTGDRPTVLRFGSVSLEQLREVAPATDLARTSDSDPVKSPGLRHRHYSPRARVRLVEASTLENPKFEISNLKSSGFIGLNSPRTGFEIEKICASTEDYARSLFEFFRECDRCDIDYVYCEQVAERGIGAALMDRLRRAADVR